MVPVDIYLPYTYRCFPGGGATSMQGVDINELCEEFSCKAKCDGTKVVLEPQVVDDIMESLTLKKKRLEEQAALRQ